MARKAVLFFYVRTHGSFSLRWENTHFARMAAIPPRKPSCTNFFETSLTFAPMAAIAHAGKRVFCRHGSHSSPKANHHKFPKTSAICTFQKKLRNSFENSFDILKLLHGTIDVWKGNGVENELCKLWFRTKGWSKILRSLWIKCAGTNSTVHLSSLTNADCCRTHQ